MIFNSEFSSNGIPGTIDNDIFGTSHTLGTIRFKYVVEVIKIRDTASSHNRLFLSEVMGDAG
jgi:6-phosphofructokinase 1